MITGPWEYDYLSNISFLGRDMGKLMISSVGLWVCKAKQSLNNWCGSFATAAVTIITTFFANDTDFENLEERIKFAKAMLTRKHFLYGQNRSTDSKAWSRLWRSPFVLQMFTHHFNYIQGWVEVPTLDIKLRGPRTALTLSCTAVHIISHYAHCCTQSGTVSNNNILFEMIKLGNVWNTVIPKGTQYKFNDTVWGAMTRWFWSPSRDSLRNNSHLWLKKPINL
ncbi:hypothetical protein BKA83DRAFT_4129108 [Pisolithus microcarpus]|nr:hypothetical protein BKA83DRAFT_4129108 [Pisolithus microcarpus]